jgi:hypothetical protein
LIANGCGSDSVGGVRSTIVTENVPVATLGTQSLAEHETVVIPIGNRVPDCGAQVTWADPDTASIAVAVKLTTRPALLVESAAIFCGSERTGAAVSGSTMTSSDDETAPPGAEMLIDTTVVCGCDTLANLHLMLEPSENGMVANVPHDGMKKVKPPPVGNEAVKVNVCSEPAVTTVGPVSGEIVVGRGFTFTSSVRSNG